MHRVDTVRVFLIRGVYDHRLLAHPQTHSEGHSGRESRVGMMKEPVRSLCYAVMPWISAFLPFCLSAFLPFCLIGHPGGSGDHFAWDSVCNLSLLHFRNTLRSSR